MSLVFCDSVSEHRLHKQQLCKQILCKRKLGCIWARWVEISPVKFSKVELGLACFNVLWVAHQINGGLGKQQSNEQRLCKQGPG